MPIEERLELCLTEFTTMMVEHQISHADHAPVAKKALDAHAVSAQDRAELETLFYQRVSRSDKRVPEAQLRKDVIHLNRPPLRTFVKLSDSLIDRCLANGTMTERPIYEPLFDPSRGTAD